LNDTVCVCKSSSKRQPPRTSSTPDPCATIRSWSDVDCGPREASNSFQGRRHTFTSEGYKTCPRITSNVVPSAVRRRMRSQPSFFKWIATFWSVGWLTRHIVFRLPITIFVKERETGPLVVVVVSRVLRAFWSSLKHISGAIRWHRSV
jgi:hypothetical protein